MEGLWSHFRFTAYIYFTLLYFYCPTVPPLLYANPLGHRIPATLFIPRFMRNGMSGDHYEMIGKVAFGLSRPYDSTTPGAQHRSDIRGVCLHRNSRSSSWWVGGAPPLGGRVGPVII